MKHIDEYRDPALARALIEKIKKLAFRTSRTITIMEVCGSHTQAIGRYGIRKLLPENVRLISGPGCPVCVTAISDVDRAIWFASQKNVIFTTFGDMMRVPGTEGASLQKLRAEGSDIRVVSSTLDCLNIANDNSGKEVIFMGIGFETTSPTVASMIIRAKDKGIRNLSVMSVHKIIPPAMMALAKDPALNIDGFMCPGHVSMVLGAEAYRFIAESGRPAVITGFEPVDILEGVLLILEQITENRPDVTIQYKRGINPEGNHKAREFIDAVFETGDSEWRGLGIISASGLFIKNSLRSFDTLSRFDIPAIRSQEIKGCSCGDILKGIKTPDECPLFAKTCTPVNPLGPCMVSAEGTCSSYYKYH
ncbi:MAG TPA: hydrogenase formation protein HypD [Desulfomonilia bacterium]